MTKRMKILSAVTLVLLGPLTLAYLNRSNIIIAAIGFAQRMAFSSEPNRPVNWEDGGTWQGNGERPPNIVVILTDDMGFNDVSMYGGGLIETPHIDALADEGVLFANGYAGSAVCSTSRAMLLTGRYSTRFGFEFTPAPNAFGPILRQLTHVDPMPRKFRFPESQKDTTGNDLPFAARGLPPEEITLAEELRQSGYRTLHIGKWHLGRDPLLRPVAQGFDESLMMEGGLYLPVDSPDVANARNEFAVLDKVQWEIMSYAVSFNNSDRFEPDSYLTDYFTDEAVKAIAANKDQPFFLYLAHWGLHTPVQATRQDFEAVGDNFPNHRTRVYAGMIRAIDRSVGRVMQALKDNGIDDNTLIIFTSDNGGANYIGMPDINKPYRGWKLSFFEGGTHVPFVMRWPNRLKGGTTYPHAISHLDIMPTALGAASLSPQAELIDGVNLLPHLSGQITARPHDSLIWREGHYQAILSDGWKMQRSASPKMVRLFNLEQDPFEKSDLSAARAEKVAELSRLLDAHNNRQADPMWPSNVEIPIWIDKSLADQPTLDDEFIYWPN
ncbi:MAG: sulfatase-like hydrolase/transferase [Pseudomonadota bacterium]|nr:sulfatase-like hydrolase/transferase [Pseudomonadota bacterium]